MLNSFFFLNWGLITPSSNSAKFLDILWSVLDLPKQENEEVKTILYGSFKP